MISNTQTEQYLQQLHERYPRAFKRNFMFYGQIKTKGILDELKEFIPWILAIMIFIPFALGFAELIGESFAQFDHFKSLSISALGISLFFMLSCPMILKQIKHSSTSMYQQLQHIPLKLTALIILQALNIAFAQSWILLAVLFFFSMSFGFVKFYTENMFRSSATPTQYYQLQNIRRICFWAYKQTLRSNLKLLFSNKKSQHYQQQLTLQKQYVELYVELINFENKLCMTHKHLDLEHYLDSMM